MKKIRLLINIQKKFSRCYNGILQTYTLDFKIFCTICKAEYENFTFFPIDFVHSIK